MNLDPAFAARIADVHGDAGRDWLARLTQLLGETAARWSLRLGETVPRLSYNFVCFAERADGSSVVLKAGPPCPELSSEMEALRWYRGRGSVRVLESDAPQGVMLLERIEPGQTLLEKMGDTAPDRWATKVAADVMRNLHRPPPEHGPFRTVESWAAGLSRLRETFGGGTGPFPREIVETAEALFRDLLASQGPPVLLHGDLHHENILDGGDSGFLAIDPKGVVGEAAYECGAFLLNPLPDILREDSIGFHLLRIQQLADGMGADRRRVRNWAIAQAVLSAWWSYEDHGEGWEPAIRLAQIMTRIHISE